MTKFIIIGLFALAAVVAWIWFRRRPVLEEPLAHGRRSDEQPSAGDAQGGRRTDDRLNAVIESVEPASVPTDAVEVGSSSLPPQPLVASMPAICAELVEPPPNSPPVNSIDIPSASGKAAIQIENGAVVSGTGTTQPSSASPLIASLRKGETVMAAETLDSGPSAPHATTLEPPSDVASRAAESAAQAITADEKRDELSAPLDTATASPSTTAPGSSNEAQSEANENSETPRAETEPTPKAPIYQPPKPPRPRNRISGATERTTDSTSREEAEAHVRLRLKFGRGLMILTLVPDWRAGMPDEVDITGTQGELRLVRSSRRYEDIPVVDVSKFLREGVTWWGSGDARRWRWVLGGRELYVLTSGEAGGLYPFGLSTRLVLNAKHVVLTTVRLRESVEAALKTAGCSNFTTLDEAAGVPSGWLLFRDVVPTMSVPQLDERNILNPLCPAHEIEVHFIGGVRLKHRTWLAGYPPRIRFSGLLGNGFKVTIDEQLAQPIADGSFEARDWDAEGRHRLEFGQKVVMYALVRMQEDWEHWPAHNCGTGAAICGASTHRIDGARWRQFCIPAGNPLLIGARPGEIFRCRVPNDAHTEWILALVPFTPVWALPMDRLPKRNCSATVVLVEFTQPLDTLERPLHKLNATSALRQWVFAIRNARRKQFKLAVQGEDTKALWRRYGDVAKRLRRQLL